MDLALVVDWNADLTMPVLTRRIDCISYILGPRKLCLVFSKGLHLCNGSTEGVKALITSLEGLNFLISS